MTSIMISYTVLVYHYEIPSGGDCITLYTVQRSEGKSQTQEAMMCAIEIKPFCPS